VKGGRGEPTLNGVFVGHLQFEAPGRTIGTATVSCGIGRCRARMGPGNAVRGSNYQAAQGAVQESSTTESTTRRRQNALSENGECVPARGPSTSVEPQIRSDSEGSEKEAEAPITALKWSGERRDEVEKDGVGYTKLHRIQ
jgi:hypothetical protein